MKIKATIIQLVVAVIIFTGCKPGLSKNIVPINSIKDFHNIVAQTNVSYIYFGRPTCPDCNDFFPILEQVITEKRQKIFYFNTDTFQNSEGYSEIIDIFKVKWIPTIYKVENNKIVAEFGLRFERNSTDLQIEYCKKALNNFLIY